MEKHYGEGWKENNKIEPTSENNAQVQNKESAPVEPIDKVQILLNIVRSQIGVEEDLVKGKDGKLAHRNTGKEVETYLSSIGLNGGYAWCMAFVYWCYKQAFDLMELDNPLIKTGGVLNQWNKIDAKYKKDVPSIGSIFIMDYGKGKGHTGIVESVEGEYIKTIEGNTNYKGSREGYKVERKTRLITKCKGFIKIF